MASESERALQGLISEKQRMKAQIEQAGEEITRLAHNYEAQVKANGQLREEMRSKEDQFRSKMSILETELKRFMQENSSRAAEASQEEVQRLQAQYELKLQRHRQELSEREAQLDKARA